MRGSENKAKRIEATAHNQLKSFKIHRILKSFNILRNFFNNLKLSVNSIVTHGCCFIYIIVRAYCIRLLGPTV